MPEVPAPVRLSTRVRARWPIALLLLGSGLIYTWNLAINHWANSFYSAAVWAGSRNLEAAFFGSIDPANAMSIDKPPAAFWLPEIAVRLFGLSSWTLLLPNALLGVATVGMVYLTVRRVTTEGYALFGASVTALTPVAALMFRYNNPDPLLAFLLVSAGYATLRATERGSRRWLVLAGTLVGFGILAKMLQAGLVVPVFAGVYLLAAPGMIKRRVVDLLYAVAAIVVSCGWWFAAVALVPASHRPFIDGTTDDSMWGLVFGYNGLGRISGSGSNSAGHGAGAMRLLSGDELQMVSWLLPAAAVLALIALFVTWRRPRTDAHRATLVLAAGSVAVSAVLFSFMQGIYHSYYTLALAPWIGVLVGVGAPLVSRRVQAGCLAIASIWSWHVLDHAQAAHYRDAGWALLVLGLAIAAALVVVSGREGYALLVAAALVVSAGPLAYSLRVVHLGLHGSTPAVPAAGASPVYFDPYNHACPATVPYGIPNLPTAPNGGEPKVPAAVANALADQAGYTWAAAVPGSPVAAGYELASRRPVMALGGFRWNAPGVSLVDFQSLVEQGRIRYFIPICIDPAKAAQTYDIEMWVVQHFAVVKIGGVTLIDLTKPRAGVQAS